jgi:membrane AbrB-like protein
MMNILLFLLLSFIGGAIGILLKVPAGALLGSMILIGALQATNMLVIDNIPQIIRWIVQAVLGLMIGLMFSRDVLKITKKTLSGLLIVGFGGIISAFLLGFLVYGLTGLSFKTSVIAAAPGGIAEMLTLADSMDADTQAVALLHLLRFFIVMSTIPIILSWMVRINKRVIVKSDYDEE